jgi:hypothetical protein
VLADKNFQLLKENPDLTQAEYGEHFGVSQSQIHKSI